MTDVDCDPLGSLQAEASPDTINHPLSVPHSEPCPTARALLRSRRLTSAYDHARALGAVQVATNRQNGTPTAR